MCTAVLGAATGEIKCQSFQMSMMTSRLIQSDDSVKNRANRLVLQTFGKTETAVQLLIGFNGSFLFP